MLHKKGEPICSPEFTEFCYDHINLMNKYFVGNFYVPGTVLGLGIHQWTEKTLVLWKKSLSCGWQAKYLFNRSHTINPRNVGIYRRVKVDTNHRAGAQEERGEDCALSGQWSRDPEEASSREPWGTQEKVPTSNKVSSTTFHLVTIR